MNDDMQRIADMLWQIQLQNAPVEQVLTIPSHGVEL